MVQPQIQEVLTYISEIQRINFESEQAGGPATAEDIPWMAERSLSSLMSVLEETGIYPSSTHVRALEKFLLRFFLLALNNAAWSQVFI
jgi:hypothetical protein